MAQIRLRLATPNDRDAIYKIRHDVYASELGQHQANVAGTISDALDEYNEYLVAIRSGAIIGFISITPPGAPRYSIEKYLERRVFPFELDRSVCEFRILTVREQHRGTEIALLLMFGALQWAETNAASRIIAMGRHAVLPIYGRIGFELLGKPIHSGLVEFEAMTATTRSLRERLTSDTALGNIIERGLRNCIWELPFDHTESPARCVHGGDSFQAIGEDLQSLDRREEIISADVLDAWFPPSPRVIEALTKHLPWLLETSPPISASGLVRAISRARGIPEEALLVGAGSSEFIYFAFPTFLNKNSRVLVLDPMYGEYAFICEERIHCMVDRFRVEESDGFTFNAEKFEEQARTNYDLIVLVNPNNPTGTYIPFDLLEPLLTKIPDSTIVWIDEAYIDYVPGSKSLEAFAARSSNVLVSKTLSKAYALSGARVAYLVGPPQLQATIRKWTPPWNISLPAQLAAIETFKNPDYYAARHGETQTLRIELLEGLSKIPGIAVISGQTNFLLCKLSSMDLQDFLSACHAGGLYLRDVSTMGSVSRNLFRISVKDRDTNKRMVRIIKGALR